MVQWSQDSPDFWQNPAFGRGGFGILPRQQKVVASASLTLVERIPGPASRSNWRTAASPLPRTHRSRIPRPGGVRKTRDHRFGSVHDTGNQKIPSSRRQTRLANGSANRHDQRSGPATIPHPASARLSRTRITGPRSGSRYTNCRPGSRRLPRTSGSLESVICPDVRPGVG